MGKRSEISKPGSISVLRARESLFCHTVVTHLSHGAGLKASYNTEAPALGTEGESVSLTVKMPFALTLLRFTIRAQLFV